MIARKLRLVDKRPHRTRLLRQRTHAPVRRHGARLPTQLMTRRLQPAEARPTPTLGVVQTPRPGAPTQPKMTTQPATKMSLGADRPIKTSKKSKTREASLGAQLGDTMKPSSSVLGLQHAQNLDGRSALHQTALHALLGRSSCASGSMSTTRTSTPRRRKTIPTGLTKPLWN